MTQIVLADGIELGARIAEKYTVERILGRGGMGVVVAARHVALDQQFAIKILLPEVRHDRLAVDRFLREARLAARLTSDHAVRVTDVGTLDDGAPYMVMELLEGHDLEVELAQRGPFSAPDAVDIILEAIDAVAEAHAAGVVHRDLKPSNLFMVVRPDRPPILKVLDFGISKLTGAAVVAGDASMTASNTMVGSPAYMSPEQVRASSAVDARSDIWALAVILYELLDGSSPFYAETVADMFVAILQAPIRPIARSDEDVPPGLRAVLSHALERDRDQRHQSAADFALALAPYGSRRGEANVMRVLSLTDRPVMTSQSHILRSGHDRAHRISSRVAATPLEVSTGGVIAPPPAPGNVRPKNWTLGVVGALVLAGACAMVVHKGSMPAAVASPAAVTLPPVGAATAGAAGERPEAALPQRADSPAPPSTATTEASAAPIALPSSASAPLPASPPSGPAPPTPRTKAPGPSHDARAVAPAQAASMTRPGDVILSRAHEQVPIRPGSMPLLEGAPTPSAISLPATPVIHRRRIEEDDPYRH